MNSAARIAAILHRGGAQPPNNSAKDGWAGTFSLEKADSPERTIEMVRLIGELRVEVDLAEAKIKAFGKPKPERWKPAFDSFRKALTIDQITSTWNQYLQHFPPPVVQMLAVCGDILPEEEDEIALEQLNTMAELVRTTRAEVLSSDLSPTLKAYMLRQLDIVERGLRDYQIQGARALGAVVRDIAVQIVEEPAKAKEAQGSPAGRNLIKLLRLVAAAGPYVALVNNLLNVEERVEHLLKPGDAPDAAVHAPVLDEHDATVEEQMVIKQAELKRLPAGAAPKHK